MKRRSTYYKKQTSSSVAKHRREGLLSFRRMLLLSTAIVFTLIIVFSSFADAHNDQQKYYTSVCVESGQTLWDISGIYYTPEYSDREAYIQEVMQLNHLTSADIHSGNYLIVPYYGSEPL